MTPRSSSTSSERCCRPVCAAGRRGVVIAGALAVLALAAGVARAEEVVVHATRQEGRFVVDTEVSVPAPADVVWSVLVDYEHMERFMPSVKATTVKRLDATHLEVEQTVETKVGPFRFASTSSRRVELRPTAEIRSVLIGGDLEFYEGHTKLVERGGATLMVSHTECAPKAWVPPFIGRSLIESETRRQMDMLLAEIARRAGHAPSATAR